MWRRLFKNVLLVVSLMPLVFLLAIILRVLVITLIRKLRHVLCLVLDNLLSFLRHTAVQVLLWNVMLLLDTFADAPLVWSQIALLLLNRKGYLFFFVSRNIGSTNHLWVIVWKEWLFSCVDGTAIRLYIRIIDHRWIRWLNILHVLMVKPWYITLILNFTHSALLHLFHANLISPGILTTLASC